MKNYEDVGYDCVNIQICPIFKFPCSNPLKKLSEIGIIYLAAKDVQQVKLKYSRLSCRTIAEIF